jgi:hypothetical protein
MRYAVVFFANSKPFCSTFCYIEATMLKNHFEDMTFGDREYIHRALAETTIKHIDRNNGLFSALTFDPAANPSQMLETVHLEPAPSTVAEADGLATFASPDFYPFIRERMAAQKPFMSAIRALLKDGTHIFPVTTHGRIIDVALWDVASITQLGMEDYQRRNGLIISRGVTTIGAFGMAASEVVQKAGNVFLSFPRTKTIDGIDIDQGLIRANNRRMRREIHSWLGLGMKKDGKMLHIAWSGKTDDIALDDAGRPEKVVLGKVFEGTVDIVKRGLVLPIVMHDGVDPVFEIGELTPVKNTHDIERVQEWQRSTLAHALNLPAEAVQVANR